MTIDANSVLRLDQSYASGNTWVVTVTADSLTSKTIHATVICSPEQHTMVFSPPRVLQGFDPEVVPVNCPVGQFPTGGGGRVSGGEVYVFASNPNGDRWEFGVEKATGGPRTVEAFVVCSPKLHRQFFSPPSTMTSLGGATARQPCPTGEVTGGGALGTGTALDNTTFDGNGWRVGATNVSGAPQTLTAAAVCTG
ncbi:hypothetical protein ACSNOH_13180 [Streptomyces sp. URMC 127]|uniref:hypothetical protein n=1 Tax=Streptomyces sp. URMC 127 TaxID=3423402 RepID=UPI003F1CCEC8